MKKWVLAILLLIGISGTCLAEETMDKNYKIGIGESVYRCELCGGVYKTHTGAQAGCLVIHGPNDCCHMGEEMLERPQWKMERVPIVRINDNIENQS